MFLIGDPKQAIYSFRGADVFAYMQAAQDVEERFTLDKNWRSTARLVEASEPHLPESCPILLFFPRLNFTRCRRAEATRVSLSGKGRPASAPLKLWVMRRTEPDKPINKGRANRGTARGRCERDCAMASGRDQRQSAG